MIKVVKEKDQIDYTIKIYDFYNKQKMYIFWGDNGDLYWDLKGCDGSDIVVNENDEEAYNIFNKMYNGIVNSREKPIKSSSARKEILFIEDMEIYAGDVREYDEYNFYDPVEQSINYGTENTYFDENIGTESLIKTDNSYIIRFKGEFDVFPSICISPSGSRYGKFYMFYSQCYNKLLKIAIDDPIKVEEEFNKVINTDLDVKEKDKH